MRTLYKLMVTSTSGTVHRGRVVDSLLDTLVHVASRAFKVQQVLLDLKAYKASKAFKAHQALLVPVAWMVYKVT
jgi:hypothetical protein